MPCFGAAFGVPGRTHCTQHGPGVAGKPFYTRQQETAKLARETRGAVAGRQQLLGVEGVPLRPVHDLVDRRTCRRMTQDGSEQLAELTAGQRVQDDPLAPVAAMQFGQQQPQRVTLLEFLQAIGHDQAHRRAQVTDQVLQNVPR